MPHVDPEPQSASSPLQGLVLPIESTAVRTRRAGVLTMVVAAGETVAEGSVIATIDSAAERCALQAQCEKVASIEQELLLAKVEERIAESKYKRLYDHGNASPTDAELLRAEAQKASVTRQLTEKKLAAEKSLCQQLERELESFELRTPIGGIVKKVIHYKGEVVATGELIAEIEAPRYGILVHLPATADIALSECTFRCAGSSAELEIAQQTLSPVPGKLSVLLVDQDDPLQDMESRFVEVLLIQGAAGHERP